MGLLNRRHFLLGSAATMISLSYAFGCKSGTDPDVGNRLKIVPHPERTHGLVPRNFMGLSYESNMLSDASFFTASNEGLVNLFRKLTPNGLLRIGGNTSDNDWWNAGSSNVPDALPPTFVVPPQATRPYNPFTVEIKPQSIVNLQGFLNAAGWTCIYGLNFASNTAARAAEEAAFVAKTLGSRLEFFQIGNEPDLFQLSFRNPATWSADRYFDEWVAMASAVRAVVPHARFGLPDVSWNPAWIASVVNRLLALPATKRPNVVGLTHHYYPLDPRQPTATIPTLLKSNPRLDVLASACHAAAAKIGVPYYVTEANTCFSGGKAGVSDVFASALWAADYVLKLMSLGYAGVNFHGGKGAGAAFGQYLSLKDPESYHPSPDYSPICSPSDRQHIPQPIFYGMQFASNFAGAKFIDLDFSPGDVNATAYAAKLENGKIAVAVINKDPVRSLEIDLSGFSSALFLRGSSLTSRGGVELVGPLPVGDMSTIPQACGVMLVSKA